MLVYDCLQHICDFYCLEGLLSERQVKDYQKIFKNVRIETEMFIFETNLSDTNASIDFSITVFPEKQKHIIEEVKLLGWNRISEILRLWIENRNLFVEKYCWFEFDKDATLKEKMEPNIFISLDINNKTYDTKTLIFEKLYKCENRSERNKIIKNFDFLQSKMISGVTFNAELGVGIMLQRKNELRFMINFNSLESLSNFLKGIKKTDYRGISQLIEILKLLTYEKIGSLGSLSLTLSPLGILDTVGVEVYSRDWNIMLNFLKKRNLCKDHYIDKFNLWYKKSIKSFINKINYVKLVYSNSDGLYAKVYFKLIKI